MITITPGAPIAQPLYQDNLEDEVNNKVARSVARGPLNHVAAREVARQLTSIRRQLDQPSTIAGWRTIPGLEYRAIDPWADFVTDPDRGLRYARSIEQITYAYEHSLGHICQALSAGRAIDALAAVAVLTTIRADIGRLMQRDAAAFEQWAIGAPTWPSGWTRTLYLPIEFTQATPVWKGDKLVTTCFARYGALLSTRSAP